MQRGAGSDHTPSLVHIAIGDPRSSNSGGQKYVVILPTEVPSTTRLPLGSAGSGSPQSTAIKKTKKKQYVKFSSIKCLV